MSRTTVGNAVPPILAEWCWRHVITTEGVTPPQHRSPDMTYSIDIEHMTVIATDHISMSSRQEVRVHILGGEPIIIETTETTKMVESILAAAKLGVLNG